MKRSTLNLWIDIALLCTLMGLVWTGLLIYFVLPPGIRGGHGWTLWGLNRHQFGDIHVWMAIIMCVLSVIHLIMHWSWLTGKLGFILKTQSPKSFYSALILIVLTTLLLTSLYVVKKFVVKDTHFENGHKHHLEY